MMNEVTMNRAAFVAGAGALACALAGCSGGLGGASGAKKATTADAACVDDNANVTVYAAINLDGADLVRLLKHQNYEWQGESVGYGAADDAGLFAFTFSKISDDVDELANSAIPLSESEYEELEPGGGDDSVAILLSVGGYTTGDRAHRRNRRCVDSAGEVHNRRFRVLAGQGARRQPLRDFGLRHRR